MQVLVTGGGGFLGQAIVHRLLALGEQVRIVQRSEAPNLVAMGVECLRGDIADPSVVETAIAGCDIVYHVAAKAGVWGNYDQFYRANVVGTENIVNSCLSRGVRRLIYTSSPSVVFDGRDESGIDESAVYPQHYLTHYPKTKAIAEQRVLAANGPHLSTVSLRPHLIWGPGDNHLLPRLMQRARTGRLRRVGDGKNIVDTTYIDNAADAHIQASNNLVPNSPAAGKAYFVSNGEPVPLWDLIDRLLACGGMPPIKKRISASAAYWIGAILELAFTIMGRKDEPPMTRFVARQLATDHWFRLDAARRDFGYTPHVSIDEGLRRLADELGRK